jgi:hypothetical protein
MPAPYNPPIGLGTSSTTRRGSSGSSLTYGVSVTPSTDNRRSGVRIQYCGSGYTNISGKTVSAWVYITGTALPSCSGDHSMTIGIAGSGGSGIPASTAPVLNSWFQVSGTVTSATYSNSNEIDISFYVNCTNVTGSWTVYVDDVVVGG